jgi:signal transduction histidine kinase
MELQAFIRHNFEMIVQESEAFARTLQPAAKTLTDAAVRSSSSALLSAIAEGMHKSQVGMQGNPAEVGLAVSDAKAAEHGAHRQHAGFDLSQLFAEFGFIRSRILALWRNSGDIGDVTGVLAQVDSFNTAVDQTLNQSVQHYVRDVGAARDMFLAVLAHDLRSPLHGIAMANNILASRVLPDAVRIQTAMRASRATKIMDDLITDFLEFTRSRLGAGIPVDRSVCDLGEACEEALDVIKASEPDRKFVQQIAGNLLLYADYARLRQVLSNLLNNAVQHGDQDSPVILTANGESDAVTLAVTNSGKPIPFEAASMIFEPLVQVPTTTSDATKRPKTSLGLGLFIAREIVRSHQGTISVQSSPDGKTVFTVRLPRVEGASS